MIVALFMPVACATGMNQGSFGFVTDRNLEVNRRGYLLADSGEGCRPVYNKRIVYVLFHLPLNEMGSGELSESLSREKGPYAIRYRTVVYPGDIIFSALGFMASVLTSTRQVDVCPTRMVPTAGDDLRRLDALKRFEAERQRLSYLDVPFAFKLEPDLTSIRERLLVKDPEDGSLSMKEGVLKIANREISLEQKGASLILSRESIVFVEILIPGKR